MRLLTGNDVTFTVHCLEEIISVEGNASCIDPETDKQQETWIYAQLDRGNSWAWCTVKVTAHWENMHGSDFLGCCSYLSEKDFIEGGYYQDMKNEALGYLNDQIKSMADKLAKLGG